VLVGRVEGAVVVGFGKQLDVPCGCAIKFVVRPILDLDVTVTRACGLSYLSGDLDLITAEVG